MSVIDEIKNKAKANKKTVVLPETTDMRTLTAAAEVISEEIADIILVGKEDEIKAKAEGLDLSKASFVDPENCDRLNTYIESLCEARKSKGLPFDCLNSLCGAMKTSRPTKFNLLNQ